MASRLVESGRLLSVQRVGTSYKERPVTYSVNAIEVAQRLVSIPSYQSERVIGKWIAGFMKEHGPTGFKTQRLETDTLGRDTIIVSNHEKPDFIAVCHIDTVLPWIVGKEPGQGQYEPFGGIIDNARLYGRGASDAKSGAAGMLAALASFAGKEDELPQMMYAFTSREESDFGGMHAITAHFKKLQEEDPNYKPLFILSANGSNGEIGWQCRGVVALELVIKGKSGHAAIRTPGTPTPINALQDGITSLTDAGKLLKSVEETSLGATTYNIASAIAGVEQRDNNGNVIFDRNSENMVPDRLEVAFEARPNGGSTIWGNRINADTIISLIQTMAKLRNLQITDVNIKHDLPAWIADRDAVRWFEEEVKKVTRVSYVPAWPAKAHGYDEGALLVATASKGEQPMVPAAIFGFGNPATFHQPDESIELYRVPLLEHVLQGTLVSPELKRK